jgi:hypothetical protein
MIVVKFYKAQDPIAAQRGNSKFQAMEVTDSVLAIWLSRSANSTVDAGNA